MPRQISKQQTATVTISSLWTELTKDRSKPNMVRVSARDLCTMLTMMSTLLDNGMPLQKVLLSLASDPSMRKHAKLLKRLHNRMVEGLSLHNAISGYPKAFPLQVVQQIKLGEASGNLSGSLKRIVNQIEGWLKIRSNLFSKLSYPALVITAGSGLMVFMLTTVVPQFETIYSESKVSLPWITSIVTSASRTLVSNLWLPLIPLILIGTLIWWIRTNQAARRKFDFCLLKTPIIGGFVRDLAVLQFLRGVHALSEAGFVPIDAISQASHTVTNQHVKSELNAMSRLMVNGTKLSVALDRLEYLVPTAVRQLIMVGEHSGNITNACEGACEFITNRLDRRVNGTMALIEPVLTIGLATCIGWIVLAMYMPMFKMFDVLDF